MARPKNTTGCSVNGCEGVHFGRGWCHKHYCRWWLTGNLETKRREQGSVPIGWFLERIELASSGCWLWTGQMNDNGYGRITIRRKPVYIHRWSYEQFIGPIPEGLHIDHVRDRGCVSKACVNPEHLEAVTLAENTRRAQLGKRKTHCRRGHPLTEDNLYLYPDGRRRECLQCHRARVKRAQVRRRVSK